jgi:hypothetical protein
LQTNSQPASTPTSSAVPTATAEDAPDESVTPAAPAATAPVATPKPSSQKAEDILAMIRSRQKQ